LVRASIGLYDCLANPLYRSAQGNLGIDDAFSINWDKYFSKIKKHPSGIFLMIKHNGLGFLIFNNGNFTVTRAKNDEIIINFLDKVKKIVLEEKNVNIDFDIR